MSHDIKPPRSTARLSRLPRAPASTVTKVGHGEPTRDSSIPRLRSVRRQSSMLLKTGEQGHSHQVSNEPYQVQDLGAQSRHVLPHEDLSIHTPIQDRNITSNGGTAVESTVDLSSDLHDALEAHDNDLDRQKRRPRPSLSERTIDTLAQIPASPSPVRKAYPSPASLRPMAPPPRPLPSRQESPGQGPVESRPNSPQKYLLSDSREATAVTSRDHPSTPSKQPQIQTLRDNQSSEHGSRIARPSPVRANSSKVSSKDAHLMPASRNLSKSSGRIKSLQDIRATSQRHSGPRQSLSAVAKEVRSFKTSAEQAKIHDQAQGSLNTKSEKATARPSRLSRVESSSTTKKTKPSDTAELPCTVDITPPSSSAPKSSRALRDTIAKAKAAKRQQTTEIVSSNNVVNPASLDEIGAMHQPSEPITAAVLEKRVQKAIVTGTLNLAGLDLKAIPEEVLKMYEFDEGKQRNWSEAVDLTKLILADNDLTELPDEVFPDWSLQDLEADDEKFNSFAGLEVLDLRGNKLTKLPLGLRRLSRLHTLVVSNNQLKMDAFEVLHQIPCLQTIDISGNRLSGALPSAVSTCTQLRSLILQDNNIDDVSVGWRALKSLQKLDISSNMIQQLAIAELVDLPLVELNVSRNRVSGTFFDGINHGFETLGYLNLSSNELNFLSSAPLWLRQLQTLILDNNQLQDLSDLNQLQNLSTLTVSNNCLNDIPSGFCQLEQLRTANFASNNIRILDPYISQMDNLSTLELGGNPLRDRKYFTMPAAEIKADLSKRLTAVHDPAASLALSDAARAGAQEDSRETDYKYRLDKGALSISGKHLSALRLEDIELTSSVHTIRLTHNNLDAFPETLLSHGAVAHSLKTLDLSYNPSLGSTACLMSTLHLPSLQSLVLASCCFTSLESLTANLNAPQLATLNISANQLTGPLTPLREVFPSLTTLLSSDNAYTSLEPSSISGLEVLDIRNNEVAYLHPKIGELGNHSGGVERGRLRSFECSGNKFRVPRLAILEKGTEAVLKDLRRMVAVDDLGEEWRD